MGRLIDADKLKEHYSWWSGDRQADKELFDEIVDLQPTCNQLAIDCINRQDAIDVLTTWESEYEWDAWCGENWLKIESDIITPADVIAKLPSAQPEIIMCKDCKKYKTKFCVMDIWHKDVTIYRATPEDYCSRAERKEE